MCMGVLADLGLQISIEKNKTKKKKRILRNDLRLDNTDCSFSSFIKFLGYSRQKMGYLVT